MRSSSLQSGISDNAPEYRQVFLIHVHRLLQIGYSRLVPAQFGNTEEPVITGRIAEEIEQFLDEPPLEGWEIFYEVFNEHPERDHRRKGNERLKTDIRIKSSGTSPRLRFIFEAKRLRDGGSLRAYFNEEGIGAFLNEEYAKDSLDAGMLGYVQTGTPNDWAARIENRLIADEKRLRVIPGKGWRRHRFDNGPEYSFLSSHSRSSSDHRIDVYHSLLVFC